MCVPYNKLYRCQHRLAAVRPQPSDIVQHYHQQHNRVCDIRERPHCSVCDRQTASSNLNGRTCSAHATGKHWTLVNVLNPGHWLSLNSTIVSEYTRLILCSRGIRAVWKRFVMRHGRQMCFDWQQRSFDRSTFVLPVSTAYPEWLSECCVFPCRKSNE